MSNTEKDDKAQIEEVKRWSVNDYLLKSPGPLAVPSVAEMYKYSNSKGFKLNKRQLTKARNQLEVVSKYKKLGYTVRKKNALWLPSYLWFLITDKTPRKVCILSSFRESPLLNVDW